jgi:quinol-cytochrome oxidoreductase complex cytochrome b subunit
MGSLLLSSHLYGAYAMIFLGFVHFYRGYYLGVYKKPREFIWIIGTLLLVLTLGMGFTGYLLPYTQLSLNATNVGLVLALRLPTAGPLLGPLLLADGTSQGLLSRFFAAHVLLIPLALGALLYAHIALFESHGIAPPATSDPIQRRRYTADEDKKNVRFFPHILFYITKWALLYVGLLFGIAALWPWQLPTYVGNLAAVNVVTEPDWYFLWLFKVVDFVGVTPILAVGLTTVIIGYVILLPFLDRSKRTHPRDRPFWIFIGNSLMGFFILTTVWGGLTPGIQISPMQVAERMAPIFLVNALLVAFFYRRYRIQYQRRLLEATMFQRTRLPGTYPVTPPPPAPRPTPGSSAPSEVAAHD